MSLKEKLDLIELELRVQRNTHYKEQITGLKSGVSEIESGVNEKDQKNSVVDEGRGRFDRKVFRDGIQWRQQL